MTLDLDTFATKTGVPPESVTELSRLNLLPPVDQLDDGHVVIARFIIALERSGVALADRP